MFMGVYHYHDKEDFKRQHVQVTFFNRERCGRKKKSSKMEYNLDP